MSSSSATGGRANLASGRKLYGQICVSCHGPDGNMIADHKLSTLKTRRDRAATIGYIKDPKPPMPKLYPDLLTEQNVADVAAYVHEDLAR
jgi:alcohol dehydrogenase (cytochrome c)